MLAWIHIKCVNHLSHFSFIASLFYIKCVCDQKVSKFPEWMWNFHYFFVSYYLIRMFWWWQQKKYHIKNIDYFWKLVLFDWFLYEMKYIRSKLYFQYISLNQHLAGKKRFKFVASYNAIYLNLLEMLIYSFAIYLNWINMYK